VFRYALLVNNSSPAGYAFSGENIPFFLPGSNCFIISVSIMWKVKNRTLKTFEYILASGMLHELGHTFGINGAAFGCDTQLGKYPWQPGWWIYRNYKSVMNYRYTYSIFDYSDGSHGRRDSDDWSNMDLTYFEPFHLL
jgi:hypothetical protein